MRFLITNLFVPIIAVAALVLVLYSINLNTQTKVRLDEVVQLSQDIHNAKLDSITNIDSLRNAIVQLDFEKQSYTANLSMMSDWFILFQTILFGIFFLVGYGVFDSKITDSYEKSKDAYKSIDKRYHDFEKEFIDLKFDVYESISDTNALAVAFNVDEMLAGRDKYFPGTLVHVVKGVEFAQKAYLLNPNKTYLIEQIDSGIDLANVLLKKMEGMDKTKFKKYFLEDRKEELSIVYNSINTISTNGNQDIKNLCAQLNFLLNKLIKE